MSQSAAPRAFATLVRHPAAVLLSLVALNAVSAGAQSSNDLNGLAPRSILRLAAHAKAIDSVATRTAEWQRLAASAPTSPSPRYALALLSRYDARYADGLAWLDSAARVADGPVWRAAIARERISTLLSRGEYSALPPMLSALARDTAGLPAGELAEVKYVLLGYQRRLLKRMSLADIDAIAAITPSTDSTMLARLGCLRAVADRPRALAHGEEAIALARAARAPFIVGNCEFVLGSLYVNAGMMEQAMSWLDRAEVTARAAHDDPTLAVVLQWKGSALRSLGYVPSARRQLTDAIRIGQRIDDRNVQAWGLLGIAATARLVGDAPTTSSALQRALALFEATSDIVGMQNVRIEQAQLQMSVGDLEGALRTATRARTVGDSLGQITQTMRSIYAQSDIAVRSSRMDDASRLLDEAEPWTQAAGTAWLPQLQEYRGLLALQRGDPTRALTLLNGVYAELAPTQFLYRHTLSGALSLALLQTGDSVRAAATLEDANLLLDAFRDTLSATGLRRVIESPDSWGGTSGSVDQVLAAFVRSTRWLPTVFAVAERARSRELLNGTLAAESPMDSVALTKTRQRTRATATVLADVQRSLKAGTALLIYTGGRARARTSLMVVTRRTAQGFTVAPLDSLDRDIVRWLALLESGETGTGAGRRVAASVLANALRSLPPDIRRLVIVPSGPLYRVPFQALPFGSGVLGDRAIVTIAPSVSLALQYAALPGSVPARVLAIGAGSSEASFLPRPTLTLSVERSERGDALAPLQAAADEAIAAAGWSGGSRAFVGDSATESGLKRESSLGGYSVLHTAAHALTSNQALGANWLILRADSTDDGYVSGGELAALSAGRAMVVLSGCRTTGDFASRGDALDGLVAPLLARGVRTVVASHWAVSDRWTRILMERFYASLASGVTTAEAMNLAQGSLRRAGVPARYWAAFSVIGDGALTFTPVARSGEPAGAARR